MSDGHSAFGGQRHRIHEHRRGTMIRRLTGGIRGRILLPFGLLAIGATVATATVAITIATGALEQRLASQFERVSEMVVTSGFTLNRPVLERLKSMVEADIVTLDPSGRAIVSTLGADTPGGLLDMARDIGGAGHPPGVVVSVLHHAGRPYRLVSRVLPDPPGARLLFLVSATDIETAKSDVTRAILVIAGFVILLVVTMTGMIARSLTSPIDDLVAFTRRLGTGDRTVRAPVRRGDEIGTLAQAFNDMADRVREYEVRLVESERLAAAGRLAAGVAHDVRNPLSSMKMHVQILRSKLPPRDAAQEEITVVLREIERVDWVVRGLLDLVRPAVLDLKQVRVDQLLADALELTGPQLAHRKVRVEPDLAPDTPAVMLDAERMTQALLNVILNAAEAMPEGGTLHVRTAADGPRHMAVIEIADTGVGIDPAVRVHIFDPFFTTKRDGVGLGLVNARTVIEQHGGTIELLGRDDGGTRAVIRLPAETIG